MENIYRKPGMKFVYTATAGEKKVFILNQSAPKAVIGRNSDCEIQTNCTYVSRVHAVLVWEDGRVYVMFPPVGRPMNGLSVDGVSLQENMRIEVHVGSRLSVGDFCADVYAEDAVPGQGGIQVPTEGVVFFYRFGKTEIRSLLMNSRNRIAVIGSSADSELCVPESRDMVSPHHAVLIWLSDHVYIHRHPECQLPHETILNCGSMYEQKLPNGLYGVYPDSIIRIGNVDVFAFYPEHAFKPVGELACISQIKNGTSESIDATISGLYQQIRIQNEIIRHHSQMMVGYGPPPVV